MSLGTSAGCGEAARVVAEGVASSGLPDDLVTSPPPAVLAAFGLAEPPQSLPGGMGQSSRAGDVVLKPTGDEAEAAWLAELQDRLRPNAIRTPRPVRAYDGRWVVDGWTAAAYLPGVEQPGRWAETMAAGRALHAALADEPAPPFMAGRTHRWARADRVAWREAPSEIDVHPMRLLTDRYSGLYLPVQLVHCDLAGNVLFHDVQPPAVIDLSLYLRPPAYAEAVVAVDAMLWHGADSSVLDLVRHPDATQLLLRAAVFRLELAYSPEHQGPRDPIEAYEKLADRLAGR